MHHLTIAEDQQGGDALGQVLDFSGNIGRYIAPSDSAASLNLLSLVHPALRAELRTALVRGES